MLPRALLLGMLLTTLATAGEYFRFEAAIGPGHRSGSFHGWVFDEAHEKLRIVDREPGENPKWNSLGDAFTNLGAAAGCNAGYTAPDGKPYGLLMVDSKKVSPLDPKNVVANGVLLVRPTGFRITSAATVTEADLAGVTQAVQAGPVLIENGQPAAALDTSSFARHMVLLGSGSGQWAVVYVPSATLDGLARMLVDGTSFPRFKVTTALNLGTGLSSGLWMTRTDNAMPLYLREADPVRSGIAILKR